METNDLKAAFQLKLAAILGSRKAELLDSVMTRAKYEETMEEVRTALQNKSSLTPLNSKDYRRLRRFDILSMGGVQKLISVSSKPEIKYYVADDECFDILHEAHVNSGHKGTRVMNETLKRKYCNISREVIDAYLELCKICEQKKKHPKKGLVVKPMVFTEMNSRCQVLTLCVLCTLC
jgi:hypothetical protein